MKNFLQGGAVLARVAHNHAVGEIPTPATNLKGSSTGHRSVDKTEAGLDFLVRNSGPALFFAPPNQGLPVSRMVEITRDFSGFFCPPIRLWQSLDGSCGGAW